MRLQKQLIQHDPENGKFGDCYRTCVGIILGIAAKKVPHFCDELDFNTDDNSGVEGLRSWLKPKGYGVWQNIFSDETHLRDILLTSNNLSPSVPFIITGRSERANHCVVAMDGKIICDPHTGKANKKPFIGPAQHSNGEEWWWTEVIAKLPEKRL